MRDYKLQSSTLDFSILADPSVFHPSCFNFNIDIDHKNIPERAPQQWIQQPEFQVSEPCWERNPVLVYTYIIYIYIPETNVAPEK